MKKVSKYMKYIVFIMILFVVTSGNIEALSCSGENTACKLCEYSFEYLEKTTVKIEYKAVDKGNGNILLENDIKIENPLGRNFSVDKNVTGSSFRMESIMLYCPKLYWDVKEPLNSGGAYNTNNEYKINVSTNKNTGYADFTIKDLGGNSISLSEDTKKTVTCAFEANVKDYGCNVLGNQTITFNVVDGKLPIKEATEEFNLSWDGVTAEDIIKNGKCDFSGYLVCQKAGNSTGTPNGNAVNYNPTCTFSKQPKICTDSSEIKNPEELDKDENKNENNTGNVGNTGGITFGDGPADCQYVLGQILDEAQILFDIIKIIAPILVITFGSLDFVKATIAMDDKGMKTAMNKFPKRLMAAAALFFLPYLINLVLGLPGLGIENAVCGIGKVVFKLW